MPQAQISKRLSQARALVLPSIYECGGAVVLEAMASKRAVIAVNWGGPADYMNSNTGILVDPVSRKGVIEGFTNGIVRLSSDIDLAREMGNRGYDRVVAEFSWQSKTDRIIEIYNDTLEEEGSSSAAGQTYAST